MTSIKEALEIVRCMIQGDQIEAAIVDTDTMASLGDVVRAALAQLDSADARSAPWRYEVQHGPDGEADYAWVYDEANNLICTAKTHHAKAIVDRLSTGLLPDASPGNGAVTSSVVAKIEEARDLFWDIKGDFSDPRTECRRGADLLEEVLTALHSTSAAGETTSSDGGVEGHAEGPQGHSCSREPEAGNTASSGQMTPAGIKPGPSEAIPAASGGKHNGHHLR